MFKIVKKSKKTGARRGKLKTAHGVINTPFFMPVATQGVAKQLSTEEIGKMGAQIILANTYHLMLRPGAAVVKKAGGLHQFMNWPGAILTDSGGFQIFSLAQGRKGSKDLVKLTAKGVEFKSYLDGSRHYLTPEGALKIQCDLGVDIAVCLDECVALPASRAYLAKAVALTTAWAARSKKYAAKLKKRPLVFAVIQGGLDKELRLRSLAELAALDFDGYNIGGLSVGESASEMYQVLDYLAPAMPENKPRYLMGVGYPENIVEAVKRGVDMFDCVIPTREGRHGRLFRFKPKADEIIATALSGKKVGQFYEQLNINNAQFAKNFKAINPTSIFPELKNLSLAYLHHLFKVNEPLGQRLASLNNLEFYLQMMEKIRDRI